MQQVSDRSGLCAYNDITRKAYRLMHKAPLTDTDHAQSYVHGQLLLRYEPQAIALGASNGYETPSSKRLMRATVLASDFAGAARVSR